MAFLLLLLYTVFLLLRPQDFIPALAGAPYMMIFLAGAFAATLLGRRLPLSDVPTLALLALVLVMMLSTIANGWAGGVVPILSNFGTIVITYLICAGQLRDGDRLRWFCLIICACTSVIVLHSIQQAEAGIGWTGAKTVEGNRVTWVGIFNDPNDLGLLFLVALPMLLMRARLAGGFPARSLWYLLAAGHIYAIWLTHSRGAMLTLILMAAIAFLRRYGAMKLIAAGLVALPGLYLVFSHMRAIQVDEESAYGRIDAWYTAIQLFRENPLLGVGMDAFTDYHDLTAHNSYLLVLAELGAAGYMLWTLMISAAMLMVWRASHGKLKVVVPLATVAGNDAAFSRPIKPDNRPSSLQVEGSMILYSMVAYLSASFFLSRSYIVLLYILCGMAVAYFHKARQIDPDIASVTAKSLTLFVVLMVPFSLVGLYLVVRFLL
ncbi:MAG: O-antigen ligase family protein [Alcanivoracaceae bacterium]|nr:O-antigen ligase family protein [Alcanivoracaceae bacterium]